MNINANVLPPANGKKLWRVKRTPSASHSKSSSTDSHSSRHSSQTSIECLNNSLKIAAAAAKFTLRRPPLRRPKNKPGKPKDFVFVDLSPIKSDDVEQQEADKAVPVKSKAQPEANPSPAANLQLPSPTLSLEDSLFDLSTLPNFDAPPTASASTSPDLGLGIMNLGIDWDQPAPQPFAHQNNNDLLYGYQQTMMQQQQQIQQLQRQLLEQQQRQAQPVLFHSTPALQSQPQFPQQQQQQQLHSPIQEPDFNQKRPRQCASSPTAGQLQFKSYQPKPKHSRSSSEASVRKPQHKKQVQAHRCMSLPYIPSTTNIQQQQLPEAPSYTSTTMQNVDSNVSLDDFMMLNDQLSMSFAPGIAQNPESYTPATTYSEDELAKPVFNQFSFQPPCVELSCGFEEFLTGSATTEQPSQYQSYPVSIAASTAFNEFEMGAFCPIIE
ncbi:uncharacterized protein LODBEIA_P57090 [Lodderomyces beijingensis]|uniref:Uncharacterized protein n=1 Tax=Lodderomyces beijingensis TaxID=1775926 RepID=A0ABP0ZTM7_9ASCO